MKRGPAYKWIPLWVDKWLWGSTRHELNHDERAIFIDLMALASKDDGHVRANEQTPYPVEQLAGMLNAPQELLVNTIKKCVQFHKITEKDGFYFINNWNEYRLTGGYKRAVTAFNKAHIASPSKSMYKSKSSSINKNLNNETQKEFDNFWAAYPKKVAKQDALKAYIALRKSISLADVASALNGYNAVIKREQKDLKYVMYPATFLRNEKWKDFIGITYKPPL